MSISTKYYCWKTGEFICDDEVSDGYVCENECDKVKIKLYQIQFPRFFEQMMKEMERHYPEKGDSYHGMSVEGMESILKEAIRKYWNLENDYPRKIAQVIDIADICAMLYMRLCDI